MKKVQAIVRPEMLEPLKDASKQAGFGGMTVAAVHGCGTQGGWKEYFRGSEIMVNMLPKMSCEFVVEDDQAERLIDVIVETCRTGNVGDGKIFVSPVEEVVRIRTGERGGAAL